LSLQTFGSLGRSPLLGNKHERKQVDAHVHQRRGKIFGNELRIPHHNLITLWEESIWDPI